MKIALLSPSLNAYSETFIHAHRVHFKGYTYYYYGGIPPEYLDGVGRINPVFLKTINFVLGKFKGIEFYDEKVALKRSFKKNKIDLVFAEYGNMGYQVMNICKELNIPLVVHFHGADISVYENLRKYNGYKQLFNIAFKIIAVSLSMRTRMIELGCNENKIVYTPCAPSNIFFNVKPKFSNPHFISVGRFTEKKAPHLTILSFSKIAKEFPKSKLFMAGDGPLWSSCKALVQALNLEKQIVFLGIISRNDFIVKLEYSLAYVQHSVTAINGDQEGTPVSISEASAAGLPVIATIHSGIQDVIKNGVTGLLVEEYDILNMSENMRILLRSKSYAKKLGENGKLFMADKFTMKHHIDTLNEAIEESYMQYNKL